MTPKQAEVLSFIEAYIQDHNGTSPTLREIAAQLGREIPNVHTTVHRYLIPGGYLKSIPAQHRGLRVVRHVCPSCGEVIGGTAA